MDGLEVQERGQRPNNDVVFVPDSLKAFAETGPLRCDQEHVSKRSRHIPCGLSPLVFAIVVALLGMIVVGAAVGGGLGASLAAARENTCSSACSSTSTPATSTAAATAAATAAGTSLKNYTVADPKQVDDVAFDCPHRNGERYATVHGQVYTITCWQDCVGYDLVGIIAYTLDACIEACSSMNNFEYTRNGNTTFCSAVSFFTNMNMPHALKEYANCWLKNGTSQPNENLAGFATARLNSAAGQ